MDRCRSIQGIHGDTKDKDTVRYRRDTDTGEIEIQAGHLILIRDTHIPKIHNTIIAIHARGGLLKERARPGASACYYAITMSFMRGL